MPVLLGFGVEADNGLAFVAQDCRLLDAAGLKASVSNYPSGKLALEGLLRGEVEMATVAQTPLVVESFGRKDIRVLAVLGTSDNMIKIVARKDAGIGTGADLRGRRIATQPMSFMHFFLSLYLLKSGVAPADAEMVFAKPDDLPLLLETGKVQAASLREPLITRTLRLLGGEVVVLEEPGLCVQYRCLVTTASVLREKPEAVRRVLRALLDAAATARRDPQVFEGILQARLGLNSKSAGEMRRQIDFRISLPQSLVVGLEDEARWVRPLLPEAGGDIPNYLEYMATAPLSELQPDAVTLVY